MLKPELFECYQCERRKPLEEFAPAKNTLGHRTRCKACTKANIEQLRSKYGGSKSRQAVGG